MKCIDKFVSNISLKHVDIILDDPDFNNRDTLLRAHAMAKAMIDFPKSSLWSILVYEWHLAVERVKDLLALLNL